MNTTFRFDRTTMSLAAGSLSCLLVLAGCGPQDGSATNGTTAAAPVPAKTVAQAPVRVVPRAPMGEVSHIETLTERPKGTGVGAVAGGVLGGVAGHQVGSGRGNDAATVAGAVGGALLGNKIERDRKERVVGYRINVRMDNGETRTFQRETLNGLQVGSRVKVEGGSVQAA